MRNECNIINELLPLYVENIVCEDTIYFIEEHISTCEKCRNKLKSMESFNILDENMKETIDDDITNLNNFKKEWSRKNRILIRRRILLIVVCVLIAIAMLAVNFYKNDFTETQGIHISGNWAHLNYQENCYLIDDKTKEVIGESVFSISGMLYGKSYKDEPNMNTFSGHMEVSAYPISIAEADSLGVVYNNKIMLTCDRYIEPGKWEQVYWVHIMHSDSDIVVIHMSGKNVTAVCGQNEEEALENYQYYLENFFDD